MSLSKYALRGELEQLLGDNPDIYVIDSTNALVAHAERSTALASNKGHIAKGYYQDLSDIAEGESVWDEVHYGGEWKDPLDRDKEHNPRRKLTPEQHKARLKKIKASKRARRRNR